MTNLRLANLASALVPGLSTVVAESAVRLEVALFVSDPARSLMDMRRWKREGLAGGRGGKVVALHVKQIQQNRQNRMKTRTRTVESPFLGLLALRGNTMSLAL